MGSPDLAHDQRQEDGGALVFDSAPLEAPLEILGQVCVDLTLSGDRPLAMVAVRLSDVAPDGNPSLQGSAFPGAAAHPRLDH